MSQQTMRTVKFVYGICLAGLTAIVGTLFIVQAWSIFLSSENSPYTTSMIREKFDQIAPVFWLWTASVIGGGILSFVLPEEISYKTYTDLKRTLERLKRRLPENDEGMVEVNKEKRLRFIVLTVCMVCCVIAGTAILTYLFLDPYIPHFNANIFTENNGAADRLAKGFPWIISAFAVGMVALKIVEGSLKRETSSVKKKIAENAQKGIKPVQSTQKRRTISEKVSAFPLFRSKWWKFGWRIGLAALGIAFVVLGICNGGMLDVYDKARNICTQCIGLG